MIAVVSPFLFKWVVFKKIDYLCPVKAFAGRHAHPVAHDHTGLS